MSDAKDPPLEVLPDGGCYRGAVIDLDGVRIRLGRTPYKAGDPCQHESLIFCQSERRIWCEGCNRTIDSFDAFLTYTRHFEKMVRAAQYNVDRTETALKNVARLRAVKVFDKAWSGNVMAPSCPHCRGGLLPQDFENGAASMCSLELELQRRKAAKKL